MTCRCCGHPEKEHMDEAGEPTPCWFCIADRAWIREEAWHAGSVRRFFHSTFRRHKWYQNYCSRCGIFSGER